MTRETYRGMVLLGIYWTESMAAVRQTWCWDRSWELTSIYNHLQRSVCMLGGGAVGPKESHLRMTCSFGFSKLIPKVTSYLYKGNISSNKAIPPNLSQTVSLTGYQMFKYMSLWGPFSFKPLQGYLVFWIKYKIIETSEYTWSKYLFVNTISGCRSVTCRVLA